jgi:hypothetical protein
MLQTASYELLRSLLIFGHLAAMIAAGISIAFGDYAILRHRPINKHLMAKASRAVAWSLAALWVTGLFIASLDMSAASLTLAESPKLQAKLTVVVALTANGYLLHRYTLRALSAPHLITEQQIKLAAILGAVSTTSWAYAMFLGVAKAWTPILGYNGFVILYALALAVAIAASLRWMRPILMQATSNRAPRRRQADRHQEETMGSDLTPLAG